MGDSLLLSSVFQFSRKIRQSIDKTAGKIRWVGKKLLLLLKMSVPINIPSIKKDTSRRNVCHRKLSLKKTLLPIAFLAFRRIWKEYFFHYSFCLFHFTWRGISGRFWWTGHPAVELFHHMQYCAKSSQPLCKSCKTPFLKK